ATHAIQNAAPAAAGDVREPSRDADGEELGAWMRLGAGVLADVLAATPVDAVTWHPFPVEQKAWVWSRRQAMETMIHRWDAEVAAVGSSDLDATCAAAGLEEFFEMLLPRTLAREGNPSPTASLHVHCTDDDLADGTGEWIVWGEDGEYRMDAAHRKGDAAIRGTAEALLLAVMGRTDGGDLDVIGDHDAATAWLDLPGL
ncbi:MAG: maleylpyruvate isomerase family mycothiol-dependent enzyme, partial [Ilumatobacter sp.]|uniref:maleylpyruvate isomerase family mycothiol-dependent enzyme n=1 Tax=Ilumatobacter sp. TaxID=1967498 RepID=UPI003C712775